MLKCDNCKLRVVSMHVCVFSSKMSPLKTVDRAQITFFTVFQTKRIQIFSGAVTIPNVDIFILQFFSTG